MNKVQSKSGTAEDMELVEKEEEVVGQKRSSEVDKSILPTFGETNKKAKKKKGLLSNDKPKSRFSFDVKVSNNEPKSVFDNLISGYLDLDIKLNEPVKAVTPNGLRKIVSFEVSIPEEARIHLSSSIRDGTVRIDSCDDETMKRYFAKVPIPGTIDMSSIEVSYFDGILYYRIQVIPYEYEIDVISIVPHCEGFDGVLTKASKLHHRWVRKQPTKTPFGWNKNRANKKTEENNEDE